MACILYALPVLMVTLKLYLQNDMMDETNESLKLTEHLTTLSTSIVSL